MSNGLQVYLISPGDLIVYCFADSNGTDDYIFRADTLSRIEDPQVSEVRPVSGTITPKFKVNPIVLNYEDGNFEVVYAPPGDSFVYLSDGSKAKHNGSQVKAKCQIVVPNTSKLTTKDLTMMNLEQPNMESIQHFIDLSSQGSEYTEIASPAPVMKMSPPAPSVPDSLREEVTELRQEVNDLKSILEALNRRIYQLYPVELPKEIRFNKKITPVVSFDEITQKLNGSEFERHILDPMLQPYAGSHRSHNRLVTFYDKKGGICHVRADYQIDPTTKACKINPPK